MNCWKSVNISHDYGSSRVHLMSIILGLISFLVLYVPFSMYHGVIEIHENGIYFFVGFVILLPFMHRLTHILLAVILYKKIHVKFKCKNPLIPRLCYKLDSPLSKFSSIFLALGPSILLTLPLLIMANIFVGYMPYLMLLASCNIALSFTDFIYMHQFFKAPKRCIIEEAKEGYDILIKP
ncbi:DUF3267 domain-containing protein [Bacillaceae bacterium S4-13-58]